MNWQFLNEMVSDLLSERQLEETEVRAVEFQASKRGSFEITVIVQDSDKVRWTLTKAYNPETSEMRS